MWDVVLGLRVCAIYTLTWGYIYANLAPVHWQADENNLEITLNPEYRLKDCTV